MRGMARALRTLHPAAILLLVLIAAGCGVRLVAEPEDAPDYLRFAAFDQPGNERILLRWPHDAMPLKLFLPAPPASIFDDPPAVLEAARRAIFDWEDAAGPDLPSLTLVDSPAEADIPIRWGGQSPSGAIAQCVYDLGIRRIFGVDSLLIAARNQHGREATSEELYKAVLHEMGHALGIGGHSPNPEDAMYGWARGPEPDSWLAEHILPNASVGLTARDRATLRALYASPIGHRMVGGRRAY